MTTSNAVRLISFSVMLLFLAGFAACSSDSSATLVINTGLGGGGRAMIGTPPPNIASYSVTISGSGMSDISKTFPARTTDIVIDGIPAGPARRVEVTAKVDAADTGHIMAWGDSAVTDLPAGVTTTVTLKMAVTETQLVVPDYQNTRVVQAGPIWTELYGSQLGASYTSYFSPYDIDFDGQGYIYIANNMSATGAARLLRIDDIATASTSLFEYTETGNGVKGVAVDRVNQLVYYCTFNTVYQSDYSNSFNTAVFTGDTVTNNFSGLAVDENGDLFLAGNYKPVGISSYGNRVLRLHYNGETWSVTGAFPPLSTTDTTPFNNSSDPLDVMVKDGRLYATNMYGSDGYRLLAIDKETMTLADHYGNTYNVSLPDEKGNFMGPARFAAILNKRFSIIDEGGYTYYTDRIVFMDSFTGDGWEPYGSNGGGTDQFRFYSGC